MLTHVGLQQTLFVIHAHINSICHLRTHTSTLVVTPARTHKLYSHTCTQRCHFHSRVPHPSSVTVCDGHLKIPRHQKRLCDCQRTHCATPFPFAPGRTSSTSMAWLPPRRTRRSVLSPRQVRACVGTHVPLCNKCFVLFMPIACLVVRFCHAVPCLAVPFHRWCCAVVPCGVCCAVYVALRSRCCRVLADRAQHANPASLAGSR